MEPTNENLMALSNYLKQTMSPDAATRKPAEQYLETVERNRGFALLLLTLLRSEDNSPEMAAVKLAAAINFKNFVKRNWKIVSILFCDKIILNASIIVRTINDDHFGFVQQW